MKTLLPVIYRCQNPANSVAVQVHVILMPGCHQPGMNDSTKRVWLCIATAIIGRCVTAPSRNVRGIAHHTRSARLQFTQPHLHLTTTNIRIDYLHFDIRYNHNILGSSTYREACPQLHKYLITRYWGSHPRAAPHLTATSKKHIIHLNHV